MSLFQNDGKNTRGNVAARLILRGAVSLYIIYIAWKIASNAGAEDNPIPLLASAAIAAVFVLAALGFIGYTIYDYLRGSKRVQEELREQRSGLSCETMLDEAEKNEALAHMVKLYREYLNATVELELSRKPFDGLLGFGNNPSKDACHEQFYEQLGEEARRLSESGISADTAAQALSLIIDAPDQNRSNQLAFQMLMAAQGHGSLLVPLLTTERALDLALRYDEIYERAERMPVQSKFLSLLREKGDYCGQGR